MANRPNNELGRIVPIRRYTEDEVQDITGLNRTMTNWYISVVEGLCFELAEDLYVLKIAPIDDESQDQP